MPIKVIKNLPAITKLAQENIFVMDTERAENQQIRPLQILLVNLMPTKEVTETQIGRDYGLGRRACILYVLYLLGCSSWFVSPLWYK